MKVKPPAAPAPVPDVDWDRLRRMAIASCRHIPPWVSRDDLVQEAYLAGWRAAGRWRPGGGSGLMPYVAQRAVGAVRDVLREHSPSTRAGLARPIGVPLTEAPETATTDRDTALDVDLQETLERALGRLTPRQRHVIVQRYLRNRINDDIGQDLGISADRPWAGEHTTLSGSEASPQVVGCGQRRLNPAFSIDPAERSHSVGVSGSPKEETLLSSRIHRKLPRRFGALLLSGALVASVAGLAGTSPAGAATTTVGSINFESGYNVGNINGQNGWSKTGQYDVEVENVGDYGDASDYGFETKSLRASNSHADGAFGGQAFSPGLSQAAGEGEDVASYFMAAFDIGTTKARHLSQGLTQHTQSRKGLLCRKPDGSPASKCERRSCGTALAA